MALNFLKRDDTIVEEADKLGGGSFTWDTGAYDVIIDSAYMDESQGGAHNINFTFKTADGKSLSETIYVTSGKAKGQLNYYVDKQGAKQYLPGFTICDHISLCATGKALAELEPEDKIVEVYNPELKKKAPTSKPVLMELIGKPVTLGIVKVKEFKNVKDASGNYVPGSDIKEFNEVAKAFNTDSKQTVVEAKAGEEAAFFEKWCKQNTSDYVKDKTKGKTPTAGATSSSAGSAAKPTTSLFGPK